MLKLKTKTEFGVQTTQGIEQKTIRVIINGGSFDINNLLGNGYFYYLNENLQAVQMNGISLFKLWADISSSGDLKTELTHVLKDAFLEGLEEGVNYGTIASDYEIDNDEINHLNE